MKRLRLMVLCLLATSLQAQKWQIVHCNTKVYPGNYALFNAIGASDLMSMPELSLEIETEHVKITVEGIETELERLDVLLELPKRWSSEWAIQVIYLNKEKENIQTDMAVFYHKEGDGWFYPFQIGLPLDGLNYYLPLDMPYQLMGKAHYWSQMRKMVNWLNRRSQSI